MFRTNPRGRAAHTCTICRQPIPAGQRHVREAAPPWTLLRDDPDTPPSPIGEWWVRRFHSACQDEWS